MTERQTLQKSSKIICVGTGRDGTLSACQMLQDIFDRTDGRRAMHEYRAREFYDAFSNYMETRNETYIQTIRQMIVECPYDCIVGNGYAAILPLFHELWGPDTRLIHLRRNRDACIASLVKNCEMFPAAYRYYTFAENATVKRMAAFHFGEITKDEWERMTPASKFGWYYDKTHSLIDKHKAQFAESIDIATETLSDERSRRAIARIATGSGALLPPATHLNAHVFDIASSASEHRDKAIWLLGRINWSMLVQDDTYGIDYFLNMFVAWMGYHINDVAQLGRTTPASVDEATATIARARTILTAAMARLDELEKLNLARSPDRLDARDSGAVMIDTEKAR